MSTGSIGMRPRVYKNILLTWLVARSWRKFVSVQSEARRVGCSCGRAAAVSCRECCCKNIVARSYKACCLSSKYLAVEISTVNGRLQWSVVTCPKPSHKRIISPIVIFCCTRNVTLLIHLIELNLLRMLMVGPQYYTRTSCGSGRWHSIRIWWGEPFPRHRNHQ